MEKKKVFNLEQFIEKYRFFVGGGLIFLILIGAGVLLYRENYEKQNDKSKIISLEERISQLENKSETLSTKSETSSNVQNVNAQNESQGQIAGASSQNTAGQNATKQTGKININSASASQLDSLPGIGAVYSQRIIDYRNANGGFKSIEEIKNVKGIGDKTFLKFKDQITI